MNILNERGEQLSAVLCAPDNSVVVIICHGFGAHKDIPWKKILSEQLSTQFSSLRFDFSGNGKSEGSFTEATYTKELHDLHSIIAWAKQTYKHIVLVGHSMAGAIVIRAASERQDIAAVIDIAGVAHVEDFERRVVKDGAAYTYTNKLGKSFPITQAFIDDTKQWRVLQNAKHLKCPLLIIHGVDDQSVSVRESELIMHAAAGKLILLPDCDHYFRTEKQQELLASTICGWLQHESTHF